MKPKQSVNLNQKKGTGRYCPNAPRPGCGQRQNESAKTFESLTRRWHLTKEIVWHYLYLFKNWLLLLYVHLLYVIYISNQPPTYQTTFSIIDAWTVIPSVLFCTCLSHFGHISDMKGGKWRNTRRVWFQHRHTHGLCDLSLRFVRFRPWTPGQRWLHWGRWDTLTYSGGWEIDTLFG